MYHYGPWVKTSKLDGKARQSFIERLLIAAIKYYKNTSTLFTQESSINYTEQKQRYKSTNFKYPQPRLSCNFVPLTC